MHLKNQKTNNSTFVDYENKESSTLKFSLSKYDYDLYDEAKNIQYPFIQVKRISLPNKGENWKIFSNNKLICLIEGVNLLKAERDYLRSSVGFLFLMNEFKAGETNELSLVAKLKVVLKG